MMPGLLVSSIPYTKPNSHEDACLESFQATGRFERRFIKAHESIADDLQSKVTQIANENIISFGIDHNLPQSGVQIL
jgi:hypothetical protein